MKIKTLLLTILAIQSVLIFFSGLWSKERKLMYIHYQGVYSCLHSPHGYFTDLFEKRKESLGHPQTSSVKSQELLSQLVREYESKHTNLCFDTNIPVHQLPYLKQLFFYVFDFGIAHIHRNSPHFSFLFFNIPFQEGKLPHLICQESNIIRDQVTAFEEPSTCDTFLFRTFEGFLSGVHCCFFFVHFVFLLLCLFQEAYHPQLSSPFPFPSLLHPFLFTPATSTSTLTPPTLFSPDQTSSMFPQIQPSPPPPLLFPVKKLNNHKTKAVKLEPIKESFSRPHKRIISNLIIPHISDCDLSASTVFEGDFVEESEMEIEEVFEDSDLGTGEFSFD